MQLTYIREWKFSVLRREIWQSKYLKMAVRCAEINPPFLSIDSIKSLFGDWLHWKPPSALDYSCTVPISFFTVQRYGHLFHYTVRCKAGTSETTLSFFFSPLIRKILCSDSRASIWVLGIAPNIPQISVIVLVHFSRSVFLPININIRVSWNQKAAPLSKNYLHGFQPPDNTHTYCFFIVFLQLAQGGL